MKKLFASLISFALLLSLSVPAFAVSIDTSALPSNTTVHDLVVDASGIVDAMLVTGDISSMGKEAYCAVLDNILMQPAPRLGGTYEISDKDTLQHNNSNLYSEFKSTIEWDFIKSSKVSGTSKAVWVGSNPYDADKITLTDKFTFAGVVVSVSADGPNWSTSLQSATWSASEEDEWRIDHIYSDISCVGYDLYVKQVSTGDFEFGTTYYTTSATDSQWL